MKNILNALMGILLVFVLVACEIPTTIEPGNYDVEFIYEGTAYQVGLDVDLLQASQTPSWTPSPSNTPSITNTGTTSPTKTSTRTSTPTRTRTPTRTASLTRTPTATRTATPIVTPTPTSTPNPSGLLYAWEFGGVELPAEFYACPIWYAEEPLCGATDQGVYAKAVWDSTAVTVADGSLVLTLSKLVSPYTDFWGQKRPYKSGYVQTGSPDSNDGLWFSYGYFEARFKSSNIPGAWPAFWLWADPDGSQEIDITEVLMKSPYESYSTLHGGPSFQYKYTMSVPAYEWHTYAVDWQAGYIAWFVDGVEIARYNGTAFNGVSMYPILSYQAGGTWAGISYGGSSYLVNESLLPGTMEVDYLRVYTSKP